ncbi:hypothetical protein CSIRO_2968 [Bradyrhizobiaceae bacterium SG-6C]|nr:hypothetical protein CSIRO_2968 [Bradyrhizobiaceae bacterium SG-6C]
MLRTLLKGAVFGVLLFALAPANNAHAAAIGDEPFWPGTYAYEPALDQPGCLTWNWQQYAWYNNCPVYARPKAYMYRGTLARRFLRTKG